MVDGISNTGGINPGSLGGSSQVGKEDFMKMLIAQLRNQDPMNPMDGTQFAAQLAQFSSLEQLTNINNSINNSIDANYLLAQSINNTMTATLIGNDVKLDKQTIEYNGQDSVDFGYNLPSDAKSVTIKIYNDAGALVKTIENPGISEGDTKLNWDFTDNVGRKVQNGSYKIEIEAKDFEDKDMQSSIYILGKINGIRFGENGSAILVDGIEYSLADVLEIISPAADENPDGNGG